MKGMPSKIEDRYAEFYRKRRNNSRNGFFATVKAYYGELPTSEYTTKTKDKRWWVIFSARRNM